MLIILTAISVSLDALGLGISYGLRGIRFPFKSLLLMNITAFSITLISAILGRLIGITFSTKLCNITAPLFLIGLGIWMCVQGLKYSAEKLPAGIITNPELGDMDKSEIIDLKEAFVIGVAISIDASVCCIGLSYSDSSGILLPAAVLIMQFLLLSLGLFLGKHVGDKINIDSHKTALISGIILLMLGFYEFTPVFT